MTFADKGKYTCTYHRCTLRFDMPAKLQRHKREDHRNSERGYLGRTTAYTDRSTVAINRRGEDYRSPLVLSGQLLGSMQSFMSVNCFHIAEGYLK